MKYFKMLAITSATAIILAGCSFGKESEETAFYEDGTVSYEDLGIAPIAGQLSHEELEVYEALWEGAEELEAEIVFPYKISGAEYARLFNLLEKQEPEFFQLNQSYYVADEMSSAKMDYKILDHAELESMRHELEKIKETILCQIPSDADDYDKLLWIHDYIAENCVYEVTEDGVSAYECLVGGVAHCEGYAKAFMYLARALGYDCVLVTGIDHNEINHAWNQVKIGDEWYNVDVTWDDTDDENEVRHTYFLRSDEFFATQHFADKEYFKPAECETEKHSYYNKNDLVITVMDDAERILNRELASGAEFLEIGFSDLQAYDEFHEQYLVDSRYFEIAKTHGYPVEEVILNVQEHRDELCMEIYFEVK